MNPSRPLGLSGPEITTVGFGAWAAGGPWEVGWGAQDDEESISAIRRSIDLGMNWVDTAAIYGHGHSEEVVGRALQGGYRERALVFTKCGRIIGEDGKPHSDLRPESIRREVEESLRRLQADVIDLYQCHWPDPETGTPVEESWSVMAALQDEGKVRWLGVSNFDTSLMARCEPIRHIDSLQPPYSMLRRDVESEVLSWCLQNGTGVIVYSPMQSGLLSGSFRLDRLAADDWRRTRSPYFQEPALTKNLEIVENLRPIADRHACTVGQLAIAWTLANPAVTAAIVGARNAVQVEQNYQAMQIRLEPEDLASIAQVLG